jgi:hypothetical protein
MSTRIRKLGAGAAQAAAVGFLIANATVPRPAKAYYIVGIALLASSTIGFGGMIAGGIYLTIRLSQPDKATALGDTTRSVVDAGLLSSHTDLGLQLSMLTESPTAFAQLSYELLQGKGASVDNMTRATGLSVEFLQNAWTQSLAPVGVVDSQEEAQAVVVGFMEACAPKLQVDRQLLASFAWQLAREQSFPSNNNASQLWLSAWLGVPVSAIQQATAAALPTGTTDLRASIYADPDAFLNRLSAKLEAEHSEEIHARIEQLKAAAQQSAPG